MPTIYFLWDMQSGCDLLHVDIWCDAVIHSLDIHTLGRRRKFSSSLKEALQHDEASVPIIVTLQVYTHGSIGSHRV